jgi:hypothetical protein
MFFCAVSSFAEGLVFLSLERKVCYLCCVISVFTERERQREREREVGHFMVFLGMWKVVVPLFVN